MTLIQLSRCIGITEDTESFYLNADCIEALLPTYNGKQTSVYLIGGKSFTVKETPETIINIINLIGDTE